MLDVVIPLINLVSAWCSSPPLRQLSHQFPEVFKHVAASGPLHILFSLPGKLVCLHLPSAAPSGDSDFSEVSLEASPENPKTSPPHTLSFSVSLSCAIST